VTDLSERPPVPDPDEGGDVRIGWTAAGLLFLVVGFGGLVVGNFVAHRMAPPGGLRFGPWWIDNSLGPYAWALFVLGLLMSVLGAVLLYLSRRAAPGPFRLPGYSY
jgi:hypothetical protein